VWRAPLIDGPGRRPGCMSFGFQGRSPSRRRTQALRRIVDTSLWSWPPRIAAATCARRDCSVATTARSTGRPREAGASTCLRTRAWSRAPARGASSEKEGRPQPRGQRRRRRPRRIEPARARSASARREAPATRKGRKQAPRARDAGEAPDRETIPVSKKERLLGDRERKLLRTRGASSSERRRERRTRGGDRRGPRTRPRGREAPRRQEGQHAHHVARADRPSGASRARARAR
jgi:hypothetical protein